MTKVILISQYPLPYTKIGSWTTMYNNYLAGAHQIDYIVCREPHKRFESVTYEIIRKDFMTRVRRRLFKNYKLEYYDALRRLFAKVEGKFIIQIVDNFGMVIGLHNLLIDLGVRQNCYVQVCYHGFGPFYESSRSDKFFNAIDEIVLLTHDSYKSQIGYYSNFPSRVSILKNGIDTKKFHPVGPSEKGALRSAMGYDADKVFIWCAKDKPKKGLSLILDAWKRIYAKNNNLLLLIAGAKREPQDGVVYLGSVPNDELPKYYQASDCYLFPSLCQEGFGLSLTEALNCGCYCIASKLGGIPEVLQYGKFGKLIENPHMISEWETAINDYISQTPKTDVELPVYTIEDWITNMNAIIENAKTNLN